MFRERVGLSVLGAGASLVFVAFARRPAHFVYKQGIWLNQHAPVAFQRVTALTERALHGCKTNTRRLLAASVGHDASLRLLNQAARVPEAAALLVLTSPLLALCAPNVTYGFMCRLGMGKRGTSVQKPEKTEGEGEA